MKISTLSVGFSRHWFLWLLCLSPVFTLSLSYSVWTTTTIDETVTVNCSTSTTASNAKSHLTDFGPTHDTVSQASITSTTSTANRKSINSFTTSLNGHDTTLKTHSTSFNDHGTSLNSHGTTINTYTTSLNGHGTSTNTYSAFLNAHSTYPNTHVTLPAASSITIVATGQSQTVTVLPGASAVIIAGTPVSLGQSGTLVIGTNTIALLQKSSAIDTLTVGGQILTIMPTGFEVVVPQVTHTLSSPASTKELIILPGDSPITIGTVPISIGRGGTLLIGGNVQVIQATTTKTFTVDGQILIASSGGLIVDLPTETKTGLTTLMTGKLQFVFSTSYISIPSLTTWSETTTKLPGQTTPTILPIWPCSSLCASGYNGIIVIPQSPLPPSTVIIPAPFTFPSLTIGSNGRPTIASIASLLKPLTTPIVSATTSADSVTSTMTTVPPGFYTEEAINSLWSTNTWITTSSGGKPTIVPVLVGCRGCGASHGGIILWNLPELPRVSFQFPGFPGLPKFHLPCIKIFGLKISGDCDDPPSTDDDSSDNPTSSPNHSDKKSSVASSATLSSLTSPSSTSPSSTLSSSISSCARNAMPSCTQICQMVSESGRPVTSSCASAVCRRTNVACPAASATYTTYLATTLAVQPCSSNCNPCRRDSAWSGFGTLPFRAQPDPVRRDFPTPSVPPGDIAGINRWFVNQVDDSQGLAVDSAGTEDLSSADEWPLSTISGVAGSWPYQVGFSGLYGCTIVIVATPEAIYMAHIWETTYFSEQWFQEKALTFLAQGNRERGWASLNFLSTPGPGTTAPLAPGKRPTIFVIAGRNKFYPNNLTPAYGQYIDRIAVFLRNKFRLSTVHVATYKAAPNAEQLGDGHHEEWGKVLIQYDPQQPDCEGGKYPTFRLLVAGESYPDIRYINYGTEDAHIGRRGTFNSSCPLFPGQNGPAEEITVSPSEFPTSHSSATLPAAQFPTGSKSTSIPSHQTFTSTTRNSIKITSPSLHSVASTLRTSFSAITSNKPVLCEPYQDPDSDGSHNSFCQCSSGTLTTTLPMMTSTNNQCGYTSLAEPAVTSASLSAATTTPPNPFPYTFTYDQGGILACQTVSYLQLEEGEVSYCAGDRETISAPPPPVATASAVPAQPLSCTFCYLDLLALSFTISGSIVPNLPDLEHQMDGCGVLTFWGIAGNTAKFYLPLIFKGGCVERAIISAGGPSISCQYDKVCLSL